MTAVTCYAQVPMSGAQDDSLVVPEEPTPATALFGGCSPVCQENHSLVRYFSSSSVAQ